MNNHIIETWNCGYEKTAKMTKTTNEKKRVATAMATVTAAVAAAAVITAKCRYLAYKSLGCVLCFKYMVHNTNVLTSKSNQKMSNERSTRNNDTIQTQMARSVYAEKWVYQPFCNILFCKSERKKVVALRFRWRKTPYTCTIWEII